MDRARTVTWSDRAWLRRGPAEESLLPSRAEAISRLATALDARRGPVLLTGEPGVGKSWVCRRLRDAMPASWRWAAVDLSPAIDAGEFLRLVLHALGFDHPGEPADARPAIADTLADGADDGRSWALIVEESQNASPGVLEELRILGNRMGEPGAFAGLILVGQNALARRLSTRPLAALQARIGARVHLRPLDVEEFRAWVGRLDPGRAWDNDAVERLHRETAGNPRKVLGLSARRSPAPAGLAAGPGPGPGPRAVPAMAPVAVTVANAKPEPAALARIPDCEAPPVAPAKPPLRLGEGMIEVGWEPSDDPQSEPEAPARASAPADMANAPADRGPRAPGTSAAVEVIDDHYAALQAWTEWAQNQGREATAGPATEGGHAGTPSGHIDDDLDPDENPSPRLSGLRAEGQHEFAPYSQLFSRLRQPRDSP